MPISRSVKRAISVVCILLIAAGPVLGYRLLYREQLYQLYRRQFYDQPLNLSENIYWLERALRADFANPLNALATIETEEEWERYRYLFTMHLNLKLVELYLAWANRYNREVAYFYNAPWRDLNLESLEKAEDLFQYARVYWDEALVWSAEAWELRHVELQEVQHWMDENHRIETGQLDYDRIIDRHLERLYDVRQQFQEMGPDTY